VLHELSQRLVQRTSGFPTAGINEGSGAGVLQSRRWPPLAVTAKKPDPVSTGRRAMVQAQRLGQPRLQPTGQRRQRDVRLHGCLLRRGTVFDDVGDKMPNRFRRPVRQPHKLPYVGSADPGEHRHGRPIGAVSSTSSTSRGSVAHADELFAKYGGSSAPVRQGP